MKKTYKFTDKLAIFFALFFSLGIFASNYSRPKAVGEYSLSVNVSKQTVTKDEEFEISIQVENTSNKVIENFEIRTPFYDRVHDASVVSLSPEFNRLMNPNEYPAGFNSKSWIINSFEAKGLRNFIIRYKVSTDPSTEPGLVAKYVPPLFWDGSSGNETGNEIAARSIDFDIFIKSEYVTSTKADLPVLEAFDNEVAKVALNARYYFDGSQSTKLEDITKSNISAFPNFKLETQDVLVEWLEPIDFSAEGTAQAMKDFDSYFAPEWGKITADPTNISFLNKKIKITFKNINSVMSPKVKKTETEIKKLEELGGTFTKESRTVVLTQDKLSSIFLYPNIETTPNVIETSDLKATLKVKVDNPSSEVSYTINGKDEKSVNGIDLNKGEFEIELSNLDKTDQVEIKSKYKNGEEAKKIVLVKYNPNSTPSPTVTSSTNNSSKGSSSNPVINLMLMAAAAIIIVIVGYLYYLYYSRKKTKKKEMSKDLDSLVKGFGTGNLRKDPVPATQDSVSGLNKKSSIDLGSYVNKNNQGSVDSNDLNLRRDEDQKNDGTFLKKD